MLCLLSALSLCLWCVVFRYGSVSRFKGVFSAVCGVCVGLCWLYASRGLCGFCVRVELGGLKACCVFCLSFIRFSSSLPFFSSLYLLFVLYLVCFVLVVFCLSSCLVFPLLLCLCVFFFPFGRTDKKKGRNFLRPLLCVVSVQILVTLSKNSVAVALARSNSFGWYSQLIQQESDGLPVLTLIFSGIMSI